MSLGSGRRSRGPWIALAALLHVSSAATAAEIAIGGLHGNETGCRVHAGGEYTGDDRFLLWPDRYEAHESGCEFVAVHAGRDGAQLATALCQGEGAYWTQTLIVSPPDPENDSLLVFFGDGALWHEVEPCS